MSSNKFIRGTASYRRNESQNRSSGRSFLIVTEGEKTEPNYFHALKKHLRLTAADVEIIHPEGTDPITLTQKAIELQKARHKQAKKGFAVAYDEVWVVFDFEGTHHPYRAKAKQAMALPEAKGIKFATSDPCFEYWLLLHHEYTTAPMADCAAVMVKLKKHHPEYNKGFTFGKDLLNKISLAIKYAKRCRDHHAAAKGGSGNPQTKVDELARNLNNATRPHFQFKLD